MRGLDQTSVCGHHGDSVARYMCRIQISSAYISWRPIPDDDFMPFFFSSRRRHTRFDCDWSSDVCSSDLQMSVTGVLAVGMLFVIVARQIDLSVGSLVGLAGGIAAMTQGWGLLPSFASAIV